MVEGRGWLSRVTASSGSYCGAMAINGATAPTVAPRRCCYGAVAATLPSLIRRRTASTPEPSRANVRARLGSWREGPATRDFKSINLKPMICWAPASGKPHPLPGGHSGDNEFYKFKLRWLFAGYIIFGHWGDTRGPGGLASIGVGVRGRGTVKRPARDNGVRAHVATFPCLPKA